MDNAVTQSAAPATVPAGTKIALRTVPYSGVADQAIAPVGLVVFAGADDAKTATDVDATNPLPVTAQRASTGTCTNVAGDASSVTLLASNANRLGATITNDSSAALYVKLGSTASLTSYTVKLDQDDYYEVPAHYTGVIDGIWASATGDARITELS